MNVLLEDNHCLGVVKPAGMLTAGDRSGDESLLDVAKEYLREKYSKPGNVFLGLVHRLDRPVSGVVLFARTSKAAGRLADQFRTGTVTKTYQAWVSGSPPEGPQQLLDWLKKDPAANTTRCVPEQTPGAKQAILEFRVLCREPGAGNRERSLLEIRPVTGRSHQIRVQLSSRGWPILGDLRYGATPWGNPRAIALHAQSLTFRHPTLSTDCEICRDPPTEWKDWLDASAR